MALGRWQLLGSVGAEAGLLVGTLWGAAATVVCCCYGGDSVAAGPRRRSAARAGAVVLVRVVGLVRKAHCTCWCICELGHQYSLVQVCGVCGARRVRYACECGACDETCVGL